MFWLETVDSTCFKSFSVRPLCAAPTAAAACPRLRMCCVNGEPLVFSPERHQQFQVEDTFRYFKIFQDIFWWKNRMANDSEDLGGILQVELKIAIVDFRSRTRPSSVSRCETWWTPRLSETWGRPVTWWWTDLFWWRHFVGDHPKILVLSGFRWVFIWVLSGFMWFYML